MAKRQFQLSEEELERFEQAEAQTRDVHELKRLQAVRLYGSGTERRVIETVVGCDERSMRASEPEWYTEPLTRSHDDVRSQRPRRLEQGQRQQIGGDHRDCSGLRRSRSNVAQVS